MEDEASTAEAIRLCDGKQTRLITLARWENVLRMWEAGKTLAEIGTWIGKSESTVRHLLKRSFVQRQRQPGFKWPLKNGKKICDIPHPMTSASSPLLFEHVRGIAIGQGQSTGFCPVCKRVFHRGKPLIEIL